LTEIIVFTQNCKTAKVLQNSLSAKRRALLFSL
jgi:hypothetical protein